MKLVEGTSGEAITEASATRDLKALVDRGLLEAHGEKRGRTYVGTGELREAWMGIRAQRPKRSDDDPYRQQRAAS
jgi:hypothetical protein